MWSIQTPWFDVAAFMSLYATGIILFGHFEQYKPAWRRLLKPVLFVALLMTLTQTLGRSWAYRCSRRAVRGGGVIPLLVVGQSRHQRMDR